MAALTHAYLGNDREARRLEELAAESLTVQEPLAKEPALLRLALLRGELEAVERLLAANPTIDFFDIDYPTARLDGLQQGTAPSRRRASRASNSAAT